MNVMTVNDNPRWYAIHTKPKQEERAESNLRAWKVKTFVPRIKERRARQSFGDSVIKPLFPRYLFAYFVANSMLHKISYTRGVKSVVKFGGEPAPIDDSIIELIQAQAAEDGYIRIGEQFKYGDKVLIKDGLFSELTGIFEHKIKVGDRVMILLTTLEYQSHVLINIEQIKKI